MADKVFAPHYAVPARRTAGRVAVVAGTPDGLPLSQLLPGEPFDVLEFTSTHAWGRSPVDGVVGFVDCDSLTGEFAASHIVMAKYAPVHADASSTSPVLARLPMGARVAATPSGDDWVEVDGGYVAANTVVSREIAGGDAVAFALALRNVAAVAGGRSGDGVDAAGLIFLTHALAGAPPARFADLQAATIGTPLAEGDVLRRGDLIFFADHVAMLVDADTAIHVDDVVKCEALATLHRFGPVVARRRPA